MDIKRVRDILKNKEKCDIVYKDNPVWIQELNNDSTAKVGFIDGSGDKDVYIKDLYESNL